VIKLSRENLRTKFKGVVHWLSADEPVSAGLFAAAGESACDGFLAAALLERYYGSGSK
jgi:hypothetical protein